MAELLTDGLCHNDEFSLVKRQSLEKEEVLDCIDEGVVYTDTTGNIQYYNRAFAEMFGIGENGRGENLLALLPHRILREYIQTRTQVRSLKVSLEHGTHQFYGFLSCKEKMCIRDRISRWETFSYYKIYAENCSEIRNREFAEAVLYPEQPGKEGAHEMVQKLFQNRNLSIYIAGDYTESQRTNLRKRIYQVWEKLS